MEQRRNTTQRQRSSRRNDAPTTLLLLATAALVVQHASAAVVVNNSDRVGGHHHLQSRQYPSDAPACAQTCIRVKIQEAADPGLATECDYRSSGYVACLCASSKFTAAYERCLLDNCIFPSSLATGRSLFQEFCAASPSDSEVSQAISVASSAVASQASVYSRTSTLNTTTSGASSSVASTSGASTMTTTGITSGASSGTTRSTGTTSGTNTGSTASQSSSSLTPEQIESARANATGVSAAYRLGSSWTLAATSTLVLLGSLVVLA